MARRTTITLGPDEEDLLSKVTDPDRPEHAALLEKARQLGVELDAKTPEATLLRLLIAAGGRAIQDMALDIGYQQAVVLYEEVHDPDEAAERRRRYAANAGLATQ